MSEYNDKNNNETKSLPEAIEQEAIGDTVVPDLALRQGLERLIFAKPERACAVVRQHAEAISRLESSARLGNLLAQTLLDRKLYSEAVEYVRLAFKWKLVTDGAVFTRLARVLLQTDRTEEAKEVLQMALAADPACTAAARGLYECACRENRFGDAMAQLERLSAMDRSYSTLAFVFKERRKLSSVPGRDVRIALLGSYTLDWLVPYLDDECRNAGLSPQFYQAPFKQYAQDILNQHSGLYVFRPDIIFLAVAIEDVFPGITAAPNEAELNSASSAVVEELLQLVQEAESRCGATIVLHEFSLPDRAGYGILDNRLPIGLSRWIANLNENLSAELKKRERAYLLPLESVMSWVGKERGINPKLTYMAGMRLAEPVLGELAKYYMRYVKPLKGLTKKCVVLDLDGTLWGGVVGELGPDGVVLGPAAPGIEYVEFQRALLALAKRGILLAVCSKNNPDDALAVIRRHPHMVLREEHFAAVRINWNNKADNIREIAQDLNIGLDSLVFIDDNPNERELIKQLLPEVLTVELPKDASLYRRMIEAMTDFELLALTQEDQMRVAQYQANSKRQAAKETARSLEEYLHSLNVETTIRRAAPDAMPRLVQLFNKTNQFNLTTKRYQVEDIASFMKSPDAIVYDLHVKDRFGDHGLVGAAVIRKGDAVWHIDSLLMSCRVMGLGIETAFLERIYSDAKEGKARRLVGEFIPTKKNVPVKEFYPLHGFVLLDEKDQGHQQWILDLAQATIKRPEWITVTKEEVNG